MSAYGNRRDREAPTLAEHKMDPKEKEIRHGHPLPSFLVRWGRDRLHSVASLTHIIEVIVAAL
jgi:hypothetical protein